MRVIAAQGPVRLSLRSIEQGRTEIPSLTVAISQPAGAARQWAMEIEARFEAQAVVREIGRIRTYPSNYWTPGASSSSRVVAIATVPGAVDWFVQVSPSLISRPVGSPLVAIDDVCDVDLSASQDLGSPGLYVAPNEAIRVGGQWLYQGGIIAPGNSSITIVASRHVETIDVFQIGTGGGVQMVTASGLTTVPLPPNGSIQLAPLGRYGGDAVINWIAFPAGGGGYAIQALV